MNTSIRKDKKRKYRLKKRFGSSKKEIKELANNLKFCGPSPDEISLLTGCKDICQFFFVGADSKRVVIQTPEVKFEVEKIISNEFESNRKMMSVLIKGLS